MNDNLKWKERKRNFIGLPWSLTKYGLSNDRLFVETGLFNIREYEVRLYRITNVHLKRSLFQRMFGLGTIHIDSSDKDLACFDIANIRNSQNVKEMISASVEEERKRNRISSMDFIAGAPGGHGEDMDIHD